MTSRQEGTMPHDGPADGGDRWPEGTRYERLRCIGRGGHGVVFEVFDRLRKRRIALKTLVHSTPASLLSFKQEFRALAGLRHPNLVNLHELVSPVDGAEFFTMELVNGEDFRHYTRAVQAQPGSPMTLQITRSASGVAPPVGAPASRTYAVAPSSEASPAKLAELRAALPQLVAGLRALHAAGKLHRDIKASNVMVSTEGRVVILDFGLCTGVSHREASEDLVSGTPEYMAPEQVLNEPLLPASDWYAVGVLLFDSLVGHPPFQGSMDDVLQQKLLVECPRPSQLASGVPDDLDELCWRLLAKDPMVRPSGSEIAQLLNDGGRAHSIRPSGSPASLVGRQGEIEVLERALGEACERGPASVMLHGPSGIGKSTLLSHFADGLRRRGRATVLCSRVYEQESIAFKAVDGVMDLLSQELEALQREGRALPPDASLPALGRLFPVLRRLPAFAAHGSEALPDPLRTREQAFEALRLVLTHVTRDKPMVWIIDDVQWGDLDSVALLHDTLGKTQVPLLLVLSHRHLRQESNAFLDGLARGWPPTVARIDLPLGTLSQVDIRELLVGASGAGEVGDGLVEQVFQMSTGNAFLAQELAHALLPSVASAAGMAAISKRVPGSLETLLLDERLRGLDSAALRLLEVVAASGRALRTETAASAAGIENGMDGAVSMLSQRRLVSSGHQGGLEVLEVRHDRIREWILLRLPEAELKARHRRLAETLEATPHSDADLWLEHWLRSGDSAQIRRAALAAAVRAGERLALKRAETLYRVALAHGADGGPQELAIRRDLARVLEWDGRGADAAESYLSAAELSSGFERSALQSAAGLLLIYAGRFARGAELLRASLREVGLPAPATRLGALASLVAGRFRLSKLEARLSSLPRQPSVSQAGQARVEILHAAAFGFIFTDPLLGECLQAAHLDAALNQGNAQQMARALALEASQRSHRSPKGAESAERLFQRAGQMARNADDPAHLEFVQACRGVSQFLCGNWRAAHALLEGAYADVPRHTAGWHTTAWIYDVFALCNQGRFDLVAQRLPELLRAAEAREDRFTATTLRVSANVPLLLAGNDPAAARREVLEGIRIWDQPTFLVQHWRAMWWGAETELYDGRAGAARQICLRDARRLQKSFLLRVQYIRGMTLFLRARCALATFDQDPKARSHELRSLHEQLASEGRSWTSAFAAMVGAGIALRAGDSERGRQELQRSVDLASNAAMSGHAQACRWLLGARLGGAEGREVCSSAEEELKRNGVSDPERYARSLLPV